MTTDKTIILVTGASGGIGLETVLALAQASPDYVILLGSRSVEKGNKAHETLKTTNGETLKGTISVLQLNVTDQKSIVAAKEQVESEYGRLDVLINNAGIIVTKECDVLTNMRETFETNVFGTEVVTQTFLPLLKKSSAPRLIHVSSDQGSITNRLDPTSPGYHVPGEYYRASKAALNMLSACHRVNFGGWGCKVCAFNPDFCVTNLTGEGDRDFRKNNGARDARDAALALVEVVGGKRDEDLTKSGIVHLDGGVIPW
ncbi:putative short chain dehydrogenase/reductase [Xylaria palmicola]|nr:putative short chain dehydrogenase/reductase [Xylaria palmicola]